MKDFFVVAGIVACFLAIGVFIAIGIYGAVQEQVAPCDYFKDYRVQQLPVRCLKELSN